MPITEVNALEILAELIKKPEIKAEDIPGIWSALIKVYNDQFAPAPEPAPKKRRRGPKNPNIGWPAGVKRDEYKVWKEAMAAKGQTENLNPQEYKRLRDLGQIGASAPAPAPKAPAPKAAAAAKEADVDAAPKRRGRPAGPKAK